jgi:hypothetical protein
MWSPSGWTTTLRGLTHTPRELRRVKPGLLSAFASERVREPAGSMDHVTRLPEGYGIAGSGRWRRGLHRLISVPMLQEGSTIHETRATRSDLRWTR